MPTTDPYRLWFAAVIVFHLVFDDAKAKCMAMAVTEGDASSGEEVVTSIQTVAARLTKALISNEDPHTAIGYLAVLAGWLFEDFDGVNDFLGEASNVQSLIQYIVQPRATDELVQGLSVMLLGIVYEFSTKDSPIPRSTLHSILHSRMGRDRYLDKLAKLRSHPLIRDFEVMPRKTEAYLDSRFVDFFKDNYSRLSRAIDRDPGLEVSVVANGVQKGISRELVDSLRNQVQELEHALRESETRLASLDRQLDQEAAEHRRTKDLSAIELAKVKNVNESLQRQQDDELR
jgi:hypothetical protein